MLRDSLYKVKSLSHQDGLIQAALEVNEHHDILKGHFPRQPVLPGACMLQMVKEVLEGVLSRKLQLKKAEILKFIQLIDPQINNTVQLNLNYNSKEDGSIEVRASLLSGEAVCFKFQGSFV